MHAAVLHRPQDSVSGALQISEVPDPQPGPGEVLVRVEACGVCRTDLQLCTGDLEARHLPVIPGHQVVGRIEAVGPDVRQQQPGARVGITWLARTCGHCRFCITDRENLCEQALFTGWDRDGGYADLVVADARFIHVLPEIADPAQLAPLLCAGVIGYRSLAVAGITEATAAHTRLGLFGFGASASLVIQIATHWGCEVHVCTRSDREQAVARELGATWAGGFDERPPVPLDAAITTAPVGRAIANAVDSLDRGGIVAVNAIHLDEVPAMPYERLWWERQIRSVANVTRSDAREFLKLAGLIPMVTRYTERPLGSANAALGELASGDIDGSVVLVP